ncbi:hypothetical protein Bca52824_003385 [Brassica carinata]|uniref:F-box associated beta-propeller type 1 domain-containing protein n=1 Tax=Brassica carinata TaxID=52824 RepID=A0A8X7WNR1_BRACI|nr:hypothetical protein Bca52824_003385 [Brassica carinata]
MEKITKPQDRIKEVEADCNDDLERQKDVSAPVHEEISKNKVERADSEENDKKRKNLGKEESKDCLNLKKPKKHVLSLGRETSFNDLPPELIGDKDTLQGVKLSCVGEEQLAVLHERLYTRGHGTYEFWTTTKIEPDAVSWSRFLNVEIVNSVGYLSEVVSFFIDEEEKRRGFQWRQIRTIRFPFALCFHR